MPELAPDGQLPLEASWRGNLQHLWHRPLRSGERMSACAERDSGLSRRPSFTRLNYNYTVDYGEHVPLVLTLTMRQVRAMLLALSYSNEPAHLVAEAKRYLQGVKGHLVQRKKILAEKNAAAAQNQNYNHNQMQMQMPQNQMPQNQNWVPQT
ncbi:hypothetical protein LTR28_005804 [Elasticomyces elasticus]|nr:hypothetical protein LTR28_005804 [Elasticomyces elasticus]